MGLLFKSTYTVLLTEMDILKSGKLGSHGLGQWGFCIYIVKTAISSMRFCSLCSVDTNKIEDHLRTISMSNDPLNQHQ